MEIFELSSFTRTLLGIAKQQGPAVRK